MNEPLAKSRAAGYRFWKPGRDGEYVSWPFYVPKYSRNTQYRGPEDWVLCRVRATVYQDKPDKVFGGRYKYRIEVLRCEPEEIIHSVETVKSFSRKAEANKAAKNAGRIARDQMDRMGISKGEG